MDLAILAAPPGAQPASRSAAERRTSRFYSQDPLERYAVPDIISVSTLSSSEVVLQSRLAASGLGASKLEPFRVSDMSNGIFADTTDPLGRVWYHIPNLGPKFCDAVRKYSIIANYREAHVVARKRSKESQCMWVGIVGDPAEYTTGSKRHLIDFLLRNPGMNLEQSGGKRNQSRSRTLRALNPLKKRRRRRRRIHITESRAESSEGSSLENRNIYGENIPECNEQDGKSKLSQRDAEISSEDVEDDSSLVSTSPSVIPVERQGSGEFAFDVRDQTNSSPALPNSQAPKPKLKEFALPYASSHKSHASRGDWLDAANRDPTFFALREPPMPSPNGPKVFGFIRNEPPSPFVQTSRKYSVEDLNDLLAKSGLD